MIAQIEQTLADNGIAKNTYLVFSSDNGLHTGEYRLTPGKLTAFDTDIHVPLVVVGPRVPAGTSTDAMTENIDLAKTFAAIGKTELPSDGHSLLPLLRGETPADWRDAILVEHNGSDLRGVDPDFQQPTTDRKPQDLRRNPHPPIPLRPIQRRRARVLRPQTGPIRATQPSWPPHRLRAQATSRKG